MACTLAWLALAVGWPAAAAAVEPPAAAVQRLMQEKDFAFCRPGYKLGWGDARWCAIAEAMTPCPGFAKACAGSPMSVGTSGTGGGVAQDLVGGKVGGGRDRTQRRDASDDGIGPAFAALFEDVLAGAALALVSWLVWQIWRTRQPRGGKPAIAAPAQALVEPEMPNPGELPTVAAALQRAEALAATQPGVALAWLYAASLRWLQDRNHLQWRPQTSNRAVLRAVPLQSPLRQPMRSLVAVLERWRFGGTAPTATESAATVQRIGALLRTVAVACAVVASAACTLPGDASPHGRALAWDLLRSQGFTVQSSALALADVGIGSDAVWIDADTASLPTDMLADIHDAVCRGGQVALFVANPQSLQPLLAVAVTPTAATSAPVVGDASPPHRAEVVLPLQRMLRSWVAQADDADHAAGDAPQEPMREPPLVPSPPSDDAPQHLPDAQCVPDVAPKTLASQHGLPFVQQWRIGKGQVFVVADNDLIANAAVAVPANAAVLAELAVAVSGASKRIALFVPTAASAANPQESLDNAGLWPLTVQGALALLVLALAMGVRFGVARDRDELRRRNYAEHVWAVGYLLYQGRATRWPAAAYALWALDRLRARLGRGVRMGDTKGLSSRLMLAQSAVAPLIVEETVAEADALRQQLTGGDDPSHLETIAALDRLLGGLDRTPRIKFQPRRAR